MKKFISILIISVFVSSCSPIKHTKIMNAQVGQRQYAGIGDTLIRIDKERNLENLFGASDIWGRKTFEGYTELKFGGIESSGEIVLLRKDVNIITNETTMSRNPFSIQSTRSRTSLTGTVTNYGYQSRVNADSRTRSTTTSMNPIEDYHVIIPEGTIAIRLLPNEKILPIEGYLIKIHNASRNSLEYTIQDN